LGLELLDKESAAWPRLVHEQIAKATEKARRHRACERVKLYRDDYRRLLEEMLQRVFREKEVYRRIETLLEMIGGTSFLKRVADEIGRPLYARAPVRRVVTKQGDAKRAQEAYNAMLAEMDANSRMDTMARLVTANAAAFGFVRYVDGVGLQLDVVTPDMLTVVPHPQSGTRELAIAYVSQWHEDRPYKHVVWDDQRYFEIGPQGGLHGKIQPHDFGMLPWVAVHQRGRTCHYWQETVGEDLVSQTKQSMFLDCIVVKKIYSQSHIQLAYVGDLDGMIKDQVTDEHNVLLAHGAQGSFQTLNLESNPEKILAVKAANEASVAANHGINRDRLNQKASAPADDAGLQERVAELAAVMVAAELRLFEVVKRVSREHPDWAGAIPADAQLLVDLGQVHNRVDRPTLLSTRKEERSMGYRSVIDDVLEDNPELGGDREKALAIIDEKMAEEALYIERRRALNVAKDASADEPGQSAEKNGAMGPAVRDGKMSKDEAAERADKGSPPADDSTRDRLPND
jgi:hypothetical protein